MGTKFGGGVGVARRTLGDYFATLRKIRKGAKRRLGLGKVLCRSVKSVCLRRSLCRGTFSTFCHSCRYSSLLGSRGMLVCSLSGVK